MPPLDAFEKMDFYTVDEDHVRIDLDLWYDNKQSDNTLSCIVVNLEGKTRYGIEDIHVL